MKNRLFIYFTIFCSSILSFAFITEEDPLKAFLSKLEGYNEATMREKVHLHLDKPYYTVGDTIWFKSYVVNAENNQLSNRSKVLYVELINERDSLKKSLRLPVTAGLAWGDFTLPESLTEGSYRIRAYTNWMRNFDEGFFFDKTITVGNSLSMISASAKAGPRTTEKKIISAKATSSDINVQFFPESGNIVSGIRSKIGFKVVGADGLGRKASGYVVNNSSEKVAEFSSEYAGMGTFSLTPAAGQVYTAKVKFDNGSEKSFELPKVQQSGYVLTVNNENENDLVIKITPSATVTPGEEIIILGQSNGAVHYVSKSQLKGGPLFASVSKKEFPGGILQLTLLNSSNQPLAERVVFIRKQPSFNLTVAPDKEVYNTRSPVKMDFLVVDSANRPLRGLFSVAVTNESDTPFDDVNESTIESNLLLSSEIKGYIETPNYYFTNPNPQKDKALDNLMLTQGWRTFDWKSVGAGKLPSFAYRPEQGISVSGKVTEGLGRGAAGAKVTLMSSSGGAFTLDTIANAEGRFNFNNLLFNEGASFMIQARNSKGKNTVEIALDKTNPQIIIRKANALNGAHANESILPYLTARAAQFEEMRKRGLLDREIVLSDVKITAVKPKLTRSSNLNGAGNADQVFVAKDIQNCPDVLTCLEGRIPGMFVSEGKLFFTKSAFSSLSGSRAVQIVLDGTYVEPNFLYSSPISMYDIESIEVLKSVDNTAIYGLRGSAGVLVINTKKGVPPSTTIVAKGFSTIVPQGFYPSRQFYSPKYDVPENKKAIDLRSTIFWAPSVITETNGKASIEFFTADKPGTYKAVIEGIDLKGSLTRQVRRFKVN